MTLEEELLTAMGNRKYLLTTLCHRSTKSTTNGFVGFQITKGLWYKLVVFLIQEINGEKTLQEVLVQEYANWVDALNKMNSVQAQY